MVFNGGDPLHPSIARNNEIVGDGNHEMTRGHASQPCFRTIHPISRKLRQYGFYWILSSNVSSKIDRVEINAKHGWKFTFIIVCSMLRGRKFLFFLEFQWGIIKFFLWEEISWWKFICYCVNLKIFCEALEEILTFFVTWSD